MTRLVSLFDRLERQLMDADEAVTIAGDRARNGGAAQARADVPAITAMINAANQTARALLTEAQAHESNESNDNV
ncbi:MAG: hypothetical protein C0511_12300 [Hyphomicrobium sp.]|nr:hypothetical protein [Hyphomicrobium sp.]